MLIGLCGNPTSGKSEVAKILIRDHNFIMLDTKEILRKITSDISGVSISSLTSTLGKEEAYLGIENRRIMGEVGLLLERLFGDDYLLNRALSTPHLYPGKRIVVDGLRRNQGLNFKGKVVEIISDKVPQGKYSFDEYNKSCINFTINNSGTLSELSQNISLMVDAFELNC